MEHWLGCSRCGKWRTTNSYAVYVPLRAQSDFSCSAMPGRSCDVPCDGCSKPQCECTG